jgi:histidine triad (HIT) family protein
MPSEHCVFCAIVAGRIPAQRVLDTPDCIAFLDVGPLAPGHTLLTPKVHYSDILEVPPDALSRILSPLPRLARAILSATGARGLNVLQNNGAAAGQVVMHLHIHLIPRCEGDSLGYRWNAGKYASGEAESMRDRLLESLAKEQ